jgi:hypothetical protein
MNMLGCFGSSRPVSARVRAIIDTGAGDEVRIRNHRQEFDIGERVIGPCVRRQFPHARDAASRKRGLQVGRLPAQPFASCR